jgi:hypothetical protein
MTTLLHRYPRYGTVGWIILLLMETAVFCGQSPALARFPWWWFTTWTTPVCWWGYLLVVDAWLYRRHGTSLLTDRRDLFALQCILSIAFWCVFEAYNCVMPGWRYVNLSDDMSLRLAGYALSFATIMPGLFLTCSLLQSYRLFSSISTPSFRWSASGLNVLMTLGAMFCLVPPFAPEPMRGYLWALVWIGWFFLLEPINYRRGMPSLFRDWEHGDFSRTLQLFLSGAICGILWEFWNMWAYTKWVYVFPMSQSVKFFEMPMLGFLGFLPFALEAFTMFHFIASFFTREDKLGL